MTERELSLRVYGVRGYPTYWFLNPEGEKLYPASGYQQAPRFVDLIEYFGESHYKTKSFKSFIESRAGSAKSSG